MQNRIEDVLSNEEHNIGKQNMRLKITVLSFKNTISANKVNHCNNDGPKNAANNAEADVKEILERAQKGHGLSAPRKRDTLRVSKKSIT